jgi:hypothetical protein
METEYLIALMGVVTVVCVYFWVVRKKPEDVEKQASTN